MNRRATAAVLLIAGLIAGCAGEARQPAQKPGPKDKSSTTASTSLGDAGQNTTTPAIDPEQLRPKPDPSVPPPDTAKQPEEYPTTLKGIPDEFSLPPKRTPLEVRAELQPLPVAAPHVASPETSPAPTSPPAEAAPPAPSSGPSPAEEGFTRLTVFYGTDRAPVDPGEPDLAAATRWRYAMMFSAVVTILLASLACFRPKGRATKYLAAGGLAVTVVLGAATLAARARSRPGDPDPGRFYGNQRGELAFGACEVSIPQRHEAGNMEGPSIFRLEFSENPEKHVVLLGVKPQTRDEFLGQCRQRVQQSAKREAFVFVHGFNVTFEDAARRTAQLAYDLEFDGPPIFFAWPSQGGLLRYAVDETNVVWTVPHLKEFLLEVARNTGAESVHLIAHSMGNRALTSALYNLSYELGAQAKVFREVVLTAPDIDAEVFRRDIAPAIVKTADRVTLYASSKDEALVISRKIHGYPRAGDSGSDLVVVPGVDTIDVSQVETGILGHSYYGSNRSVLADLAQLLREARPPGERPWLRPKEAGPLRYWVLLREEIGLGTGGSRPR